MALRHPWFSQNLKRKHPDDLISDGSNASGSGVGTGGTAYGGVSADAHNAGHDLPPNQGSDSNGRATKRIRKFESRNLERGFAELSIQPTSVSSPPHIQQQQQQPDTRAGGDDVWSGVVGGVGQSSCVVVCPDGSTLPLLRPTSVDEPPSSDVNDIQMSTQTWYEPEKDRIIVTSLDDDEYDGDDEGQRQQCAGTNSTVHPSGFTIPSAFLNAINKKLTQSVDPSTPPTDAFKSRALVLFRPLPTIALPLTEHDLDDPSEGGMLSSSPPKPPPPSPSVPSPFLVQGSEQHLFVSNDDEMEIEML